MEKRCPGCMKLKQQTVCEHCGYDETKPNELHQLPIGTVLRDQYVIGRVLGQGGFGITYLAWDENLESTVAVKEYFPRGDVSRNSALAATLITSGVEDKFQQGRDRFLKEARTLSKLRSLHNIVQMLNSFQENGTAYIIMEYVEGTTLLDYIKERGGKLTVSETFTILRPVMQALHQVHEAGMIHRDISPDNIMLKNDGTVKLLDFGTARDVDTNAGQLTHSTQAVLKYGFAPAEQYRSGREIDCRADEYALCATIYYCLTGKLPQDALERHFEQIPIPWGEIPGLTAQQVAALDRGTAIRAEDRFPDLAALEMALFRVAPMEPDLVEKPKPPILKILATIVIVILIGVFAAEIYTNSKQTFGLGEGAPETTEATTTATTVAIFNNIQVHSLAAGNYHTVALTANGTAVAVGESTYGQCNVSSWTDIVAIATGDSHTVGLKADGTVVAIGRNTYGQCEVSGWSDIVSVSAGNYHTAGLKADGSVAVVGRNIYNLCEVSGWTDIDAVAAGNYHTIGLKADGTVVAMGMNDYGQCEVSSWKDIVAVAAGGYHSVGLKADGTVVTAGMKDYGQSAVSSWTDIIAISAGDYHTVGLKADGTVVAVGRINEDQCRVSDWTGIIAIATGRYHTVGLKADGTVVAVGNNANGQCNVFEWRGIRTP